MMEHLEFPFVPLGRDIKVNSLGKLLDVFDSENLLPYFLGIVSNIASDIINAICYLHQNDIVHRDIKPNNVLVNNHYYSSKASRLNAVFQEQSIVCKLGDLGEARSQTLHKLAWSQGMHIHALLLEVVQYLWLQKF